MKRVLMMALCMSMLATGAALEETLGAELKPLLVSRRGRGPLFAGLLSGSQSDFENVEKNQSQPAQRQSAHAASSLPGDRLGTGERHAPGRHELVSLMQL